LSLPYYAYVFFSTKLEISAEEVLPGSEEGRGGKGEVGVRQEEWPKQCMHI
jgi:hypothetical protein